MSLLDSFERLAHWPERQKDFFMYVVLSRLGGIFVDADVVPLRPPTAWLGELERILGKQAVQGVRLIVGLEAHGSDSDARAWRWSGRTQLAAWAVAAAPGHSVLVKAAERYLQSRPPALHAEAQVQYHHSVAMGPGLLTTAVGDWLREEHSLSLDALESIAGEASAAVVDDAVVLGIDGFGCGQPHSGSRPCNATRLALVQHLFAGAWKTWPLDPWQSDSWWAGGRRRRRTVGGELEDWRLPALALMAHARAHGVNLTWEMVPLFCSLIVPIEPPLLPLPPGW